LKHSHNGRESVPTDVANGLSFSGEESEAVVEGEMANVARCNPGNDWILALGQKRVCPPTLLHARQVCMSCDGLLPPLAPLTVPERNASPSYLKNLL
jgi:hypothetical protein